MILHFILGALAVVSFLSTLWQWLAARRFPLHERETPTSDPSKGSEQPLARAQPVPLPGGTGGGSTPGVTLLKPVKGVDEHTEACLRSWFTQEYPGEVQILFGVANAADEACVVVNKLLAEFPKCDAQLVICPERLGANAKISKLAQLEPLVKHEIVVVSDADVRVPSDLLVNVLVPLSLSFSPSDGERVSRRTGEGTVGLVNCFYRLANPTTPAMQWEAIAVNADFWSQVLQGASFRKLDFALGAVMATRRRQLAEIGGFSALVNCLADDYQLGNRIAKRGHRIEICPVVVECWSSPLGWRDVWQHQLRWARTIRVCQPLPYFFSIVSNATLWPLLWAFSALPWISFQSSNNPGGSGYGFGFDLSLSIPFVCAVLFGLARLLVTDDLQRYLTPSHRWLSNSWLAPVKDLFQAALWVGAFTGNHIEWRGERYRLRRDGTLVRE